MEHPVDTDGGTMIQHGTLTADKDKPDAGVDDVESDLGTMVINEDEDDDDTMKRHGTSSGKYRPEFLEHLDKQDAEKSASSSKAEDDKQILTEAAAQVPEQQPPTQQPQPEVVTSPTSPGGAAVPGPAAEAADQALQKQFQQIAGGQPVLQNVAAAASSGNTSNASKFQQCIAEGDLEFLKFLSYDEIKNKMANLDQEMEREIDDLRRRYHAKRQPILDAMDQKRKRQQNF